MNLAGLIYTLAIGALGGVGSLALLAFTRLGNGLFGHALNRNLERFRSRLEGEIEELRARLTQLGDRGIRSNEREYNAIVAAWEGFVDAYLATMSSIARMDQYPDLARMNDEEFNEWAKETNLHKGDAEAIKAGDRNTMYSRYLTLNAISDALKTNFDARQCVRKQGIFIPRDLEGLFQSAIDRLSMVNAGRRAEFENRATDNSAKQVGDFMKDGQALFDALKYAARERLMYDETKY